MQVRRLTLAMAAMLFNSAAMAHASVSATDVGFSCSQTLSIDDTDGLLVGCTGDMRVFGGDERLGGRLDPNRLQVLNVGQEGRAGDVSLRVAFQATGHISGANFASGSLLSASSGQISPGHVADITGRVAGAFFGPGRDGGTVLITAPSVSPLRYAQPFVLSAPRVTSLVPEPGSSALAGCAGLVLMAVRRRQST